ncbi:MAG: patatin [Lentisphaerae bacterium]|nr:patatin [Lentisphaerota bacterium]
MSAPPHQPKIGLVLGSGGARGWAHVGALNGLIRHRVPLVCVVGTSAGALFGAAFAAGRHDVVNALSNTLDRRRLFELFVEISLSRSGLLSGRRLQRLIRELTGGNTFGTLNLPFAAVATDLRTEQEVVIDAGPVDQAVRASIAIPGIFTPVLRNGCLLVDGGLVNPLPVSVARAMGADFVIGVDVNLNVSELGRTPRDPPPVAPRQEAVPALAEDGGPPAAWRQMIDDWSSKLPPLRQASQAALARWFKVAPGSASIFEVLTQTLRLVENQITRARLVQEPPDLLVQPAVGHIQTLEFQRAREAVAAGDAAMERALLHMDQTSKREVSA